MLRELAVNTRAIYYLMALLGMIGVLAKVVNQQTLNQMLKAAGNMSKSTHRLIKLVRAKYEHACMVHDSVENTNAFVEKYIYEYRGFLFGIHTWRQMELLTVWFVGILAALGAFECYITYGFSDAAYQYIETGLAEMVLLFVISHLSDEQYKLNAVRMYMVDYLENNCAFHVKRQRTTDREELNVIAAENTGKQEWEEKKGEREIHREDNVQNGNKTKAERTELPINIEGEARSVEPARNPKGNSERDVDRDSERDSGRNAEREAAIRQILEEFLT